MLGTTVGYTLEEKITVEFANFVLETVQMETSRKELGLKDWKEHYCSGKFSSVIMYVMLRSIGKICKEITAEF